ncbi:MAG: sensor histidine kinase [Candidatus Hodarchaeales archaeon]|jgi:signal transduction histidine kinase
MVFQRDFNLFKDERGNFSSIFKTHYIIIVGLIFSLVSNLFLFLSLTPVNKYDLVMDMIVALTLGIIVVSIAYWKFKFAQKFFLIFLLTLTSSYSAFFTSFGIKLVEQDPFNTDYPLLIVGSLGINVLGFILILGYFLNNYIFSPLNITVENSNEVNKLLETQKEELSNFAHTMAHDLRSGLTNIKLYLDLLKENDAESEYIEKINQQLLNVDDLMNKSVKLADQGLIIGLKSLVNFPELLGEVADVTLTKEIELKQKNIPHYVYCDREKIFQVLKNILENATIHSKPNMISVEMKRLKNNYTLQITNDGNPFDKIIKNQFNKKINTLNRSRPLGLGLVIIKRIVNAHNWKILITEINPPTLEIFISNSDVKEN